MELDMEKIRDIFGNSILKEIRENKEIFLENISYLMKKSFSDVYELVEKYPYTFLIDPYEFKQKVDNLLDSLGVESFEKIEENLEIWGRLDEG